MPTKDSPPQVPGEGGMAGEYLGQAMEEGLHLGPAQDGRVRHVQVHLKNQTGNSVNFFIRYEKLGFTGYSDLLPTRSRLHQLIQLVEEVRHKV